MTLTPDICRCHDAGCTMRSSCRRWTERATGREHSPSLFPYDLPLCTPCPCLISIDATPIPAENQTTP